MSKPLLKPPRLAEKILRRMSLYEDDFRWTGDLEEEFRARAAEAGPKRARIWYLSQLLRAFPAYSRYLFYWSCVMLKNYFITALRNLRRRKVLSFLNLSGLALGITCFMLISLYVQSELDFDRFHRDAGRIYRVCSEHPFVYHGKNQSAITPAPLAPALKQDLPEVLNSVRFTDASNVLLSANDKVFLENSVFFASPEFFEVFSFPLLAGNPAGALSGSPYSMVISERMAKKYFDEENPLGRTIRYDHDQDFKITGILRDIPENSHIRAEFIVPFNTFGLLNDRVDFSSWSQSEFYTYIKVRENTDRAQLEGKLQPYLERSFMPGQESKGFRYFLQPMTRIHLHSDLIGEIGPNNSIRNIIVFAFIAFLILVIACINYMNLVTASSTQRGREVGIRKVLGAGRRQVVGQFFGESLMMVLLALLVSCLLVYLLLPSFNAFVERDLRFDLIEAPQLLLRLMILLVSVGVLAGCYPALVLSSFRPSAALKGLFKRKNRRISLRNGFVVFQFAISIGLVICTLVVRDQLDFIRNKDVGYRKDRIVTMRIRDPEIRRNLSPLKAELLTHPAVREVSSSSSLPHRITSLRRAKPLGTSNEAYFPIYRCTVDYDFLGLFEIAMAEGRNFSKTFFSDAEEACILNESAARALGYTQPLERELEYPVHGGGVKKARIVGIMKDFNMLSLHQGIEPLMLSLDPEESQSFLSIKIEGTDILEMLGFIRDKVGSISSAYPFEYDFFDDVFYGVYQNERRMAQMFNAFGLVAIFIACLGLFGLAMFATEQRTKEIGIRKVLGASVSGIIALLSREFLKWVLVANVLAWPFAYLVMNMWLQNFVYKTILGPGVFVLSALFVLILAMVTVLYQAVRAARADPVRSLKYE